MRSTAKVVLSLTMLLSIPGCESSKTRSGPLPVLRWTTQDNWETGAGIIWPGRGPRIPSLEDKERGLLTGLIVNDKSVGCDIGWLQCLRGEFTSGVFAGVKGRYKRYYHDGKHVDENDDVLGVELSIGACGHAYPVSLSVGVYRSVDDSSIKSVVSLGIGFN